MINAKTYHSNSSYFMVENPIDLSQRILGHCLVTGQSKHDPRRHPRLNGTNIMVRRVSVGRVLCTCMLADG